MEQLPRGTRIALLLAALFLLLVVPFAAMLAPAVTPAPVQETAATADTLQEE